MKLSKRGEYAIRALINLGIAAEVGRSLVQVAEIADHERIPTKFLEQIMQILKEGGVVSSQRGKFGGYKLSRPANKITLGEIIRMIDGPLAPIGCVSLTAYEKCSCPDEAHCGLRMVMLDVRNAIAGILDRYTIGDVVGVTIRKMRRDGVLPPFANSAVPQPGMIRVAARNGHAMGAPAKNDPIEGILSNILPEYSI